VRDASGGGGSARTFTVTSLDFFNPGSGPNDSHLIGYSGGDGGTVRWTVSGSHSGTVTTATTGSFASPVDTIRWETVGATYMDDAFGARLDNVVIAIPSP